MNLNPKYTTIAGVILAIIGFVISIITKTADVIILFFFILLGIILFLVGIAGLLGNRFKKK